MDESTAAYDTARAAPLQSLLRALLEALLSCNP